MGAIEIASAVAIVIGSVAYCCVKVIGQIESNKFKMCRCCGNECLRDVEEPTQIIDIEPVITHHEDTSKNGIINIKKETAKISHQTEGGTPPPNTKKTHRPRLSNVDAFKY